MKAILVLCIGLLSCASVSGQVSITQARKIADSVAQAAPQHYHFVRQFTPPEPAREIRFIYESREVDSASVNWQVVKIHQQSGIMDKNYKAPHKRISVVFTKVDEHGYELYSIR